MRRVRKPLVLAAMLPLVLAATPSMAQAEMITGTAEVMDSDVLEIDGRRVHLLGVESVEEGQLCSVDGIEWECYPAAIRALQTVSSGGALECEIASGPDFLDQVIARCTLNGDDIGEAFVRSGFGLTLETETSDYADAMQAARDEGAGLWKSDFLLPSEWRDRQRFFSDRPAYEPEAGQK